MTCLGSVLLFLLCCISSSHQEPLNFVIYYQSDQQNLPFIAEDIFKELDSTGETSRNYFAFNISSESAVDKFQGNLCSQLDATKFNIILDLIWNRNPEIRQFAYALEVPYFKIDPTIYPLLEPAITFIKARNGTESVFIFPKEELLAQAIYGLVESSNIRFMLFNRLANANAKKLSKKRPIPLYNTIIASTEDMNQIFGQAIENNLVKFEDRWNLLFLDHHKNRFKYRDTHPGVTKIILENNFFCQWYPELRGKQCEWPNGDFDHLPIFLQTLLSTLIKFYKSEVYPPQITSLCDESFNFYPSKDTLSTMTSEREFFDQLVSHPVLYSDIHNQIKFKVDASIYQSQEDSETELIAKFSSGQITPEIELKPTRRYFRIGTAFALPWSTYKLNPTTGEPLQTTTGQPIWEGYCIDFIHRLSEVMDFDYDIIEPASKTLGESINGKFDGVVGDLITGEIDIAVAALVTTAEREEVIDFVAPIFEETGISIVIRKPIRTTSLFKFMTVLKTEVWCSILVALVATAVMLWLVDKYSPYSGQNRKYPFECRNFSLKESFWFALTSYTPQGGGELPKSLSGRTLVATYWLFVVLILATFTANLAAFLTVQRMQTPVQSLEQLGKQSRINYTVVEGSETHQYFINMKFAEDLMYQTWKNISLASTSDQGNYRIWDYPIQEQYGQILRAINGSSPVMDAREGYANVISHTNADYAFIHDAQEIKYEMARNCDLTEIGEVFAKRPYGVAIQQGNSLLMDELTKAILLMQSQRFFDGLTEKYWNASLGNCPSDENEGMSLESLGGVFIVTIFGLGIAMVALVFEWFYYWRQARDITQSIEAIEGEGERVEGKSSIWRKSNLVGSEGEFKANQEAFRVFKRSRSVTIVEDHPLD